MVSELKKISVQEATDKVKEYPIIGIVNLENLPAQQLQVMRATLRQKGVKLIMLRKKLIKLALTNSGIKNVEKLIEKIKGLPALLFTKGNPFTLYSTLQKNKSQAPAKSGQTLPKDIVVPAGATNFAPGPIISELAAVGIKTKVEKGKLAIIADTTVAKEGDEVSPKLAETLKRLDIKPMEIGLDLVAVWEEGLVFNAKDLHIDEAQYAQDFTQAAQWAMNLAVEAIIVNDETIETLLQKGFREAKAVSVESAFLTEQTQEEILAKAQNEALSVASSAEINTSSESTDNTQTEVKEEKVADEIKKEPAETVEEKSEPEPENKVEEKAEEKEVKETPKEESIQEEKTKETPTNQEEREIQTADEKEEKQENKEQKPVQDNDNKETEEPSEKEAEEVKEPVDAIKETLNSAQTKEEPEKEETSEPHPKQGDITTNQAEELLSKLQKEGTLR